MCVTSICHIPGRRFESGSRPGGIAQLVEQDTVRCICHALLFTLLNKMKDAVQM